MIILAKFIIKSYYWLLIGWWLKPIQYFKKRKIEKMQNEIIKHEYEKMQNEKSE